MNAGPAASNSTQAYEDQRMPTPPHVGGGAEDTSDIMQQSNAAGGIISLDEQNPPQPPPSMPSSPTRNLDQEMVAACLAKDTDFGDNLVISIFDYGGQVMIHSLMLCSTLPIHCLCF